MPGNSWKWITLLGKTPGKSKKNWKTPGNFFSPQF